MYGVADEPLAGTFQNREKLVVRVKMPVRIKLGSFQFLYGHRPDLAFDVFMDWRLHVVLFYLKFQKF